MKNAIENPHIVRDFMIGNTHIQIADNCCVSKEEAEKILVEIARTAQAHITAEFYRRQQEDKDGDESA